MTVEIALREIRVLLDRYLEVSNHYSRELQIHLKEYELSPSRLNALITRLEAVEASAVDPSGGVGTRGTDEPPLGQNIVQTDDTLAALRVSADEILERLDAPMRSVPHNLWWLRKWLERDAREIAAGFPSFTFAWDMMIDLNRLTLVPDSRILRIRDNVSLATIEFERFVISLKRLVELSGSAPLDAISSRDTARIDPEAALKSVRTPRVADLDPLFDDRVKRVIGLLPGRMNSQESEQTVIRREIERDVDALALVGLELGFTCWLDLAGLTKESRKAIIMSMLVCSKLFLIEASWQKAKEFSSFAINLTTKMNAVLNLDPTEGMPMLRFNQLWARHKSGENISEEVTRWDVTGLHNRYSFMKTVLLRDFEAAIRFLETLLPNSNTGEIGNFSMAEAEEWPILEDFRSSDAYRSFKQKHEERTARKTN